MYSKFILPISSVLSVPVVSSVSWKSHCISTHYNDVKWRIMLYSSVWKVLHWHNPYLNISFMVTPGWRETSMWRRVCSGICLYYNIFLVRRAVSHLQLLFCVHMSTFNFSWLLTCTPHCLQLNYNPYLHVLCTHGRNYDMYLGLGMRYEVEIRTIVISIQLMSILV